MKFIYLFILIILLISICSLYGQVSAEESFNLRTKRYKKWKKRSSSSFSSSSSQRGGGHYYGRGRYNGGGYGNNYYGGYKKRGMLTRVVDKITGRRNY
ncbi:hypothetical protein Mgra_00005742 [Meloidogyne graminicola]|uniref:Uncharacterized protein n=1 Tax=Meloidogyne graminicola TaxID=189291 RepID=A0A8S9ZNW2_9BILA|nr:hypothetical protein Mgra_00005742 [Meloidogyne graminicola]